MIYQLHFSNIQWIPKNFVDTLHSNGLCHGSLSKGGNNNASNLQFWNPGRLCFQTNPDIQRVSTHASSTLGQTVHNAHIHTFMPSSYIATSASPFPLVVFLVSEGQAPAFEPRFLLIMAGDIEVNPGPKHGTRISCDGCNSTIRSHHVEKSLRCSAQDCTARCHQDAKCSKIGRYRSRQHWMCSVHNPSTQTLKPTIHACRPT